MPGPEERDVGWGFDRRGASFVFGFGECGLTCEGERKRRDVFSAVFYFYFFLFFILALAWFGLV
jgi:hypothetical protein